MNSFSLYEFFNLFPDEAAAVRYLEDRRWKGKPVCPHCGSFSVRPEKNAKPMPYRCRDCRRHFSVRTGTVLADSHVPVRKWLLAMYFMHSARKGVSSIQLAKMLEVTQKTAWFLLHRLRDFCGQIDGFLDGVVEVDEAYFGKRRTQNQMAVFGMRERGGRVVALPVENTKRALIFREIERNVAPGATIHSDDAGIYVALPELGSQHSSVNHSAREYVRDDVTTNSIESFWALLKRAYRGVYHFMSKKHLHRFVNECAERVNTLGQTFLEYLDHSIDRMNQTRLTYEMLVHPSIPGPTMEECVKAHQPCRCTIRGVLTLSRYP